MMAARTLIIACGGLTILLTLAGGAIVGQAKTIGGLKAQVSEARSLAAQIGVDLAGCRETKAALQAAHLACMDEIRVAKDDGAAQRETIDQLTDFIRKGSANVRREREVIYRLPQCQELRDLDIAATCPDLARSLRARAAEVSAPREGGSARPGGP